MTSDFGKLRELILLEEFKSCLPPQVKTYLKVDNLYQAAVMVDDYCLTHKSTFVKEDEGSCAVKNMLMQFYHRPSLTMGVAGQLITSTLQ